jgi:hypothetical protein
MNVMTTSTKSLRAPPATEHWPALKSALTLRHRHHPAGSVHVVRGREGQHLVDGRDAPARLSLQHRGCRRTATKSRSTDRCRPAVAGQSLPASRCRPVVAGQSLPASRCRSSTPRSPVVRSTGRGGHRERPGSPGRSDIRAAPSFGCSSAEPRRPPNGARADQALMAAGLGHSGIRGRPPGPRRGPQGNDERNDQ